MSFEDVFAPKVTHFIEAAWERRRKHLDQYGLLVNDSGTVVNDDIGDDADDDRMADERDKQRTIVNDLDYLEEQLRKHYSLNYVAFTSPITVLGGQVYDSNAWTVYGQLRSASDDWIKPVLGLIRSEQWTGEAARTFYTSFLLKFNDASELQMACVRELTLALECYKCATRRSQDMLKMLLDNAIAEMEEDGGGIDWVTVLSWVSLVSTAAGLVVFPIALGGVSLGAGALSMILASIQGEPEHEEEPEELKVEGGNTEEVIESLLQRHSQFKASMLEFDFQLDDALRRDLDSTSSFAASDLEQQRPEVADHPGEFGTLEILAAPGVPLNENPVVESIVDLFRAGEINLPQAADLYRGAARTLDEISIPQDSALYGSSSVRFADAVRHLQGVLSRTADALEDAGASLVQIAQNYRLTDDESAEVLRQVGEFLPPSGEIPVGLPA